MDKAVIKSTSSAATLSFSDLTSVGFQASYESGSLFAKISVYEELELGDLLKDFFVSITEKVKGWEEELSWVSLEGELEIHATADRLGHVEFRIIFSDAGLEEPWKVEARLNTELGQAEKISKDIQRFFAGQGHN